MEGLGNGSCGIWEFTGANELGDGSNELGDGSNEPLGFGNERVGVANEPLGRGNERVDIANEPLGRGNEKVGLGNESSRVVTRSVEAATRWLRVRIRWLECATRGWRSGSLRGAPVPPRENPVRRRAARGRSRQARMEQKDQAAPGDARPSPRPAGRQRCGPALNLPVRIDQLNPVIADLLGPTDIVTVQSPQQLCVPVAKNFSAGDIPPDVLQLVQYLDVECYQVNATNPVGGQTLQLTHLNPLLASLPQETVTFTGPTATQLCTPVAKNGNYPPDGVLPYIKYSDVLCYDVTGPSLNMDIFITHLNPVLAGLPTVNLGVTATQKLCVPVAKNHLFPPDDPTITP